LSAYYSLAVKATYNVTGLDATTPVQIITFLSLLPKRNAFVHVST